MPVFRVTRAIKALVSIDVSAEGFGAARVIADSQPVFAGWEVVDQQINEVCVVARDDLWDEVSG